ncbi:hypothetical protein AYO49_03045 [Verrucomicrobiaceae bacterium SCGC AG-212-N21]|nr:hypothetical protein AYO49_03045 [Verrucomicrobiaceae bacterium SCGC AG-212-N21]
MKSDTLCIIPARGGSMRIPRKNIRPFRGRPVITYAIETARRSGCFSEIMVSTDDEEIASIARDAGAEVPFLRSKETSHGKIGTVPVIREVLGCYAERGKNFELACALYPTAVLVRPEHLSTGLQQLLENPDAVYALPVLPYTHPIQRSVRLVNGRAHMLTPEHYATMSQDLEPIYHDAGQWFWMRTAAVLAHGPPNLGPHTVAIQISHMDAQDVDNESDWFIAEMKHLLRDHAEKGIPLPPVEALK